MMRMLRLLGLAVLVVCIAAFASGCGGGGGGGSATTPVMECPQGQVGTYPDCMDPPPTDEQRIAEAKQTLAGIVTDARARAGAASSAAAAVQAHEDATADQKASALAHSGDAQAALAAVVAASGAGNAATTLAAAESAVASARAALADVTAAQSAVASIQSAANAIAEARRQREANEVALTGGSSLIKHVRANKLLADAVLGAAGANLTGDSLVVAATGANPSISSGARTACVAPCAEYPANTEGANSVTGQRTVRIQPTGATAALVSDSTTPPLTGTGRLTHGFDLNNGTTSFVNAYTDIAHQERKGTKTDVEEDADTTSYDERYNYIIDTDYLLAGIWLTVDPATLSASRITAFAYGSQAIPASSHNFCVGDENAGAVTDEPTRNCDPTTLNSISGFVDDGKDLTATYRGNANGAYLAGSDTSYFTGDVTLTAEFKNPTGTGTDGSGSIEGAVTNIVAGGQSLEGNIELQKHTFGDAIEAGFGDDAVGVVDGKSFRGSWKGQFFGMRHTKSVVTNRVPDPDVITTTYKAQAPGSVAGTFYATQQSNPAGSAAFIGSFAAKR